MKKILFAVSAVALALSAGSAMAADLPSRKEAPVYVPPPPPPPLWTGFYGGLNIGGGWDANGGQSGVSGYYDPRYAIGATPTGFPANTTNLFFLPNGNTLGSQGGVVGGAQVGYNFQFNQFLIGAETDFQGTSLSGGGNNAPLTLFPAFYNNARQQLPDPHWSHHRRQRQPAVVRHRARPRRLPRHADLADLRHGGLRLWAGGRLWL